MRTAWRVVRSGAWKGNRARYEWNGERTQEKRGGEIENERAGLSCSASLPRGPFYIRPGLSPHLVSVEAVVEVPRYRHLLARFSRTIGADDRVYRCGNRVVVVVLCGTRSVLSEKWLIVDPRVSSDVAASDVLAESSGAKDAVSSLSGMSSFFLFSRGCYPTGLHEGRSGGRSGYTKDWNLWEAGTEECDRNVKPKTSRSLLNCKNA